ncbi:MAG: CRTAC1 family protein [Planctomycetes bacterium]|nr:CRTAC1 family protein [Planctomycetota bacterium]HPF12801.1 CRTAC1 family protein [Planctomycetota bacterium]HRV81497.1 CRTAC1 family protein [Planctomycetota bacterium]
MPTPIFALLPLAFAAQDTPAPAKPQEVWFREGRDDWNLPFTYHSGAGKNFHFPEVMGGGVALLDYDGDGWLDIYLLQGGELVEGEHDAETTGNQLFRNTGKGTFEDVTEAAKVGDKGYAMGVACGDFDRDGDIDMYVTNVGPNVFYRNNGDGTFENATEALGVGDPRWGTSTAFVDIDGDKDLDLFVTNNLGWSAKTEVECFNYYGEPDYCSPNNYNAPSPDVLYQFGRQSFLDITAVSGVALAYGNGLGVAIGDYDLDGDSDIYVANDATPNLLWTNTGRTKFEDMGLIKGCAVNGNGTPEAGMGVQFVDVDMDGDLDLFMTHLRRETNTFYLNSRGRFKDRTSMTGTGNTSLAFTGFGMGFQDFDLDGYLDLFVANGAVQAWKENERFDPKDAYAEPNHLFRGMGGTRFEEIPGGGMAGNPVATSRGAGFGDIDNDGDVDIVVCNRDSATSLMINVAERKGGWIGFQTKGPRNNFVPGARVEVRMAGKSLFRVAEPAYSYLSSNDPRVQFGLGKDAEGKDVGQVEEVLVRWADGKVESYGPRAAGQYYDLIQGQGTRQGE